MKLTQLSLKETRDLLNKKEISSLELIETYIKEIESSKKLNCFISNMFDSAIEEAKKSDNRSDRRGLEGLPISFKDNCCIKGTYTTAGSKYLEKFLSPYDCTLYENLCLKAGAISIAKNNMDDFALGSSNKSSYFGHCINPWKKNNSDEELVPGGSSGGSASAVGADLVLAATGSDTGGSIRQPASFCGIVGIKPSYGLISRYGIVSFASSLDTIGSLNKTVYDTALMMDYMQEYDPKDSTSLNIPNIKYTQNIDKGIKGLKFGIIIDKDSATDSINKNMEIVKDIIKQSSAEYVEIDTKYLKYSLNIYYAIATSEGFSNFAKFDGIKYGHNENCCKTVEELTRLSRTNAIGKEARKRSMIGAFFMSNLSKEVIGFNLYQKAIEVRELIKNEFKEIFDKVDAIIMPTTGKGAFGINEQLSSVDGYMNDFYTVGHNITGMPAISIPVSLDSNGLPTSIQITTKFMNDELMLQIAYDLEQKIQFNCKPNIWWK